VTLGHLHLKNRTVRSATWEALADEQGGPTEPQTAIYKGLAQGGVGMIVTGFTSVDNADNYFGGMARISR